MGLKPAWKRSGQKSSTSFSSRESKSSPFHVPPGLPGCRTGKLGENRGRKVMGLKLWLFGVPVRDKDPPLQETTRMVRSKVFSSEAMTARLPKSAFLLTKNSLLKYSTGSLIYSTQEEPNYYLYRRNPASGVYIPPVYGCYFFK